MNSNLEEHIAGNVMKQHIRTPFSQCTCSVTNYPCRFCFYGACDKCYTDDNEINPEPYCKCGKDER